jgi:hypothetical protein
MKFALTTFGGSAGAARNKIYETVYNKDKHKNESLYKTYGGIN